MLVPREYQIEGIQYLQQRKRALLCDDVGLGKTLQATLAATQPVLVACPAYLMDHWYTLLTSMFPRDAVTLCEGTRLARLRGLAAHAAYTIVNIEMLRSYPIPTIYETFIIDESHELRGRYSKQANQALQVAQYTPNVFMLTATPIYKDPDDLYMQLRILYPNRFKSYNAFIQEHCKYITTPWAIKVVGERPSLRALLREYSLARTYEDVGKQLPPIIEDTIEVRFSPAQQKAYDTLKKEWRFEHIPAESVGERIALLRRMTLTEQKVDALTKLLEPPMPTIIFTSYIETCETLASKLGATMVHGGIDAKQRVTLAKQSQLVVANIPSLKAGIDLSHMRRIIYFEDDPTYGAMKQTRGRVQRGDSQETILVYHLHIRRSVDMALHRLSGRRGVKAQDILREALK
jgi:superfamily II DNA or RNA helicase